MNQTSTKGASIKNMRRNVNVNYNKKNACRGLLYICDHKKKYSLIIGKASKHGLFSQYHIITCPLTVFFLFLFSLSIFSLDFLNITWVRIFNWLFAWFYSISGFLVIYDLPLLPFLCLLIIVASISISIFPFSQFFAQFHLALLISLLWILKIN